MIIQGVEALGPELPEGLQPVVERGEVARFEPIEPALAGAAAGVAAVRVHDVRETAQALNVWAAIAQAGRGG